MALRIVTVFYCVFGKLIQMCNVLLVLLVVYIFNLARRQTCTEINQSIMIVFQQKKIVTILEVISSNQRQFFKVAILHFIRHSNFRFRDLFVRCNGDLLIMDFSIYQYCNHAFRKMEKKTFKENVKNGTKYNQFSHSNHTFH